MTHSAAVSSKQSVCLSFLLNRTPWPDFKISPLRSPPQETHLVGKSTRHSVPLPHPQSAVPAPEWPLCLSDGPQPPHLSALSFESLLYQAFHLLLPEPHAAAPDVYVFIANRITSLPYLKPFKCNFKINVQAHYLVFIALWNLALACFSNQGSPVPTLEPDGPAEHPSSAIQAWLGPNYYTSLSPRCSSGWSR